MNYISLKLCVRERIASHHLTMKLAPIDQPCKEIKSTTVKRTFARSYTQRQDRVLRSARGQRAGIEPRVGFAPMDRYSYHGLQASERERERMHFPGSWNTASSDW